jgi:uncharacterized protein
MKLFLVISVLLISLIIGSVLLLPSFLSKQINSLVTEVTSNTTKISPPNAQARDLVSDARSQIGVTTNYSGDYAQIIYPMGDVPISTGACTDVVIRALRKQSVDIQQLIHEDMVQNFGSYPSFWNLKSTDSNIDHRRVPNVLTYMERQNKTVEILKEAISFLPGDIVTWDFGPGQQHIGIVSDSIDSVSKTPYIIHNIGRGTEESNILFNYPITGHIRYFN